MSLHVHSIVTESAGLPTKTTWEKRQRRTNNSQHNRRRHATQSEMRWATTGRVGAPSIACDGCVGGSVKVEALPTGFVLPPGDAR
jgi:hypothetical protein